MTHNYSGRYDDTKHTSCRGSGSRRICKTVFSPCIQSLGKVWVHVRLHYAVLQYTRVLVYNLTYARCLSPVLLKAMLCTSVARPWGGGAAPRRGLLGAAGALPSERGPNHGRKTSSYVSEHDPSTLRKNARLSRETVASYRRSHRCHGQARHRPLHKKNAFIPGLGTRENKVGTVSSLRKLAPLRKLSANRPSQEARARLHGSRRGEAGAAKTAGAPRSSSELGLSPRKTHTLAGCPPHPASFANWCFFGEDSDQSPLTRYSVMLCPAMRPMPAASITVAAPLTMSPPAKTPS